eukprot:c25717_g1_i1 orf=505-2601(-)
MQQPWQEKHGLEQNTGGGGGGFVVETAQDHRGLIFPSQASSLPSGQSSSSSQRRGVYPWCAEQLPLAAKDDCSKLSQSHSSVSSAVVIAPGDGGSCVEEAKGSSESSSETGPALKEHDYIGLNEVSSSSVQKLAHREDLESEKNGHREASLNLEETDLRLGLGLPEALRSSHPLENSNPPYSSRGTAIGFSSGMHSSLESHNSALRISNRNRSFGSLHDETIDKSYPDLDFLRNERSISQFPQNESGKPLGWAELPQLGNQSVALGSQTHLHQFPNSDWSISDSPREKQITADDRGLQRPSQQVVYSGQDIRFPSMDNMPSERRPKILTNIPVSHNAWQAPMFQNAVGPGVFPPMQVHMSGQDFGAARSAALNAYAASRVALPASKNGVKRGYSEISDTLFNPGSSSRNGMYEGINGVSGILPSSVTTDGKNTLQLPETETKHLSQLNKHQQSSFLYTWAAVKPPSLGSWQVGAEQSGGSFGQFTSLPNKPSDASADASATPWEARSKSQQGLIPVQIPHSGVQTQPGLVESQQTELNDAPHKEQVVGWPPIRSFRKNTLAAHAKPEGDEEGNAQNSVYVKVNMDGVPIGRKVDLNAYDSYEGLSNALEEMFQRSSGQGVPQMMPSREGNSSSEFPKLQLITGSDYVLTYEDKEGDWMLVGDVPWGMFVNTVRRLRITKGSEATGLVPRRPENAKFHS